MTDSKLFEKLKVYKNDANECISFKYIFDHSDLKEVSTSDDENTNPNTFKPEYTHQIFGDEESIFGYKNLKVNYFLTPGLLDAYIGLSYKEKITPKRFDGIEPDDVYGAFEEFGCSPGYTKDLKVFSEKLAQDSQFKPFGAKIWEYSKPKTNNHTYEIYKVDSSSSDHQNENFTNYLLRVQTILGFYIETFSFLDYEDTQWTHFLLYEKRKLDSSNEYRYATIGYLSVYNYYAFPDKKRSRISQVLIFPSYQHVGHGAELVEAIYRDACLNENIVDVTAEDPSPEFVKLRDFVTTKMCVQLDSFKDKMGLKKNFSTQMAQEALKKFKLPKLQSRRCYEILRLAATNQTQQNEWREYRLDIKKRFYLPFIRKSKFARNGKSGDEKEQAQDEPKSSEVAVSVGKRSLEDRFGPVDSKRFKKDEIGVTTIGFGANAVPVVPAPVSFSSKLTPTINGNGVGKKVVSFSSVTINTSNSTADNSHNDDEDEEDDDGNNQNDNENGIEKLFLSEQERKEYLEKEFQQALVDYRKILDRLQKAQIVF